jgi:formate--tetrahydrofolate ligase
MRTIPEIANALGIPTEAWEPYGHWAAKIDPRKLASAGSRAPGRIVLVTGITPSASGVGKTVSTLTLASALHRQGVRAIACLRQPSLGPVFGIKGGGAGGGRATVEPLAEVNLGLTGDLDAVTNAHNLLASLVDNHLHHGATSGLDPARVSWPHAVDLEDRALREIEIGRGKGNGPVRSSSFVITPASEVTSILGVATDPTDLRARLDRLEVGRTATGTPVTAGDLKAGGAMAALLRRALLPNLLQTSEEAPVLVHGGPFGNLSYGTTTVSSLHAARQLADVVVVEAGFATDLGGEKFVDLFAPQGNVEPSGALLVASLPCLHAHAPDQHGPGSLGPGLANLEKHIENVRLFGLEPVVSLNRFASDEPSEVAEVRDYCAGRSVRLEESTGFLDGAEGSFSVANAVMESLKAGRVARPLYSPQQDLATKLDIIVRKVYGGAGVDLSETAQAQLDGGEIPDANQVPVCIAKTQLSLSDDPKKLGRPTDFRVKVRRFVRAPGAGYIVALLGEIRTMPGLPAEPRAFTIGLAADGQTVGVK